MIKEQCIGCIHMCSCCTQSSCSTCRPFGFTFRPDGRKVCKIHGDKVESRYMFDVGEKVIISNLKLTQYDGCSAVTDMVAMSGKEATIVKRWVNIHGRVRYYIEGSDWTWSEPMFIPKELNNEFDWLDEII